jgi:hypothetical protein
MRLTLSLLWFLAVPSSLGAQALQLFPHTISMEIVPTGMDTFESTQDYLQIRIQTDLLQGSKWRLWIEMVTPPESFGQAYSPEALSWTARPPFISRSMLPDQKVLVGEGPIDGRRVEGRLVWHATKSAPPAPGAFRGRMVFTLEELP